jgi:hypothetical protein
MDGKSLLERAFVLARSRQYPTVRAIKRRQFDGGYSRHQTAKTAILVHLEATVQNRRSLSSQMLETDLLKRRKPA